MYCFIMGGGPPTLGCENRTSLMEIDTEIPLGEGKASHKYRIIQHILCTEDQECNAQGIDIPFNSSSLAVYCGPGSK